MRPAGEAEDMRIRICSVCHFSLPDMSLRISQPGPRPAGYDSTDIVVQHGGGNPGTSPERDSECLTMLCCSLSGTKAFCWSMRLYRCPTGHRRGTNSPDLVPRPSAPRHPRVRRAHGHLWSRVVRVFSRHHAVRAVHVSQARVIFGSSGKK